MTSPIDAWNERYALDRARLPGDIDELEIICCESAVRAVSHIGIELENCIFNNSALQQLRRRVAPGGKTTVRLRYNTARMDRIWVEDPVTHERFEIQNLDPTTKDLSAKQVAAQETIRRKPQPNGTVITRAQARKKMEEIYRPLLLAKTMLERRRAFKILGLISNEAPPEKSSQPTAKTPSPAKTRQVGATPAVKKGKAVPSKSSTDQAAALPVDFAPGASPPKFKIVRQAPLQRDDLEKEGSNANPD